MKACVMIDSCAFDATHLLGESFVGAGHAREPIDRGHGPLLQVSTAFFRMMAVLFAGFNGG
jgi:hypothetical protein